MEILTPLLSVAMFSAFIHAIIEVVKGVLLKPGKFLRELFWSVFRGDPLSEETIKSLIFILALLYCRAFDFDAMTTILKVQIPDEATFRWFMAYVGTASVVYVGVDVFYNGVEKLRNSLGAAPPPKTLEERL